MKHEKDCALELKEVNGKVEVFVHTDLTLFTDNKPISELQGTPILNPLDAIALFKDHSKNYQYIDRNDVEIMWCNAKGETAKSFRDVALQDDNGEYDAWLVGKIITEKQSKITNSLIGSMHWFRTIISEHMRMGEYMKLNGGTIPFDPILINDWGKRLHETSKEMIEWSNRNKELK
jgi:hypothetical protein